MRVDAVWKENSCVYKKLRCNRQDCRRVITVGDRCSSGTIPPFYQFRILETNETFESFRRDELSAYLEHIGRLKRRTLMETVSAMEENLTGIITHSSDVIIDEVEQEMRQSLFKRLLALEYASVIQARIHHASRNNGEGCLHSDLPQTDHSCLQQDLNEQIAIHWEKESNELYVFDHEATFIWYSIIKKASPPAEYVEMNNAYKSFRGKFAIHWSHSIKQIISSGLLNHVQWL